MSFSLSFTLGFLCFIGLFALCFLSVIGGKMIALTVKKYFPARQMDLPPPQTVKKANRKPPAKKPQAGIVRSIEIDPKEIDRIYVKKSS
ncbi:MAG: hypothetical protein IJW47_01905 [Clostridia bacterium]|nr:hypothetical protein [Clostridia bacterium]